MRTSGYSVTRTVMTAKPWRARIEQDGPGQAPWSKDTRVWLRMQPTPRQTRILRAGVSTVRSDPG
jgi:hypothetical protein